MMMLTCIKATPKQHVKLNSRKDKQHDVKLKKGFT